MFVQSAGERTVCQLSLRNWPAEEDEPTSVESVMALMNSLTAWIEECDSERVVVQCM